jgi:hypothetical protein
MIVHNYQNMKVYPKVSGLSRNEINNNKHVLLAAKLTRLTHKIAILLRLVAERCTICTSCSKWPVQNILDTPSYSTKSRFTC